MLVVTEYRNHVAIVLGGIFVLSLFALLLVLVHASRTIRTYVQQSLEMWEGLITVASLLNDIDKLVVADAILFKPGVLEEEEYKVVKKQLQIGYEMPKHSQRDILIGGRDSCISAP